MLKPESLITLMLVAAGTVLAADTPDLSKLPPAASKKDVTYATDIKPLFQASCFRCHTGERARSGLHLDTLEGVLKGSKHGAVVKPGDAKGSALLIAVAQLDPETAMPPKRRPGRKGGPGGQGGPPPGGAGGPPPDGAGGPPPNGGGPGGPPPSGAEGNGAPPGGGQRGPGGPPPKPLTPAQVGLVRAWIEQGAK